jgi:adenosylhomocysteine nucleosidase
MNSFVGRIVSGEAFISSNEVKNDILAKFSPYAVDMESSAIGHCAFLNKTPFVSVRCISDNADDDGAMSFDEFEKIAAKRVADIVMKMIESI